MILSFKYQLQLYAIKKYLNENYKKNVVNPTSLSKLTKKINFYEKKKDLLFQYKFTSKKVFSKTIFKRAKLLSLKRQKIIISKIKSGKKINQSEINFIKNEKEIRKKRYVNFLYKFCLYTILITYLLITIYPFLWSIFSSFKNDLEIADGSFNPFPKNWLVIL